MTRASSTIQFPMLSTTARLVFSRAVWSILLLGFVCAPVTRSHASDPFLKPSPEELSMTSVPGHPGVSAVVLFREQITKDDLHVVQHYDRIKILTEEGKKYANVELRFSSESDYDLSEDKSVGDIVGRTIHSDGTVVPFTGKPYLKTIEKGNNFKYQARIFTMPDVEVGSIIEYRYATRYNDHVFEAPDWFIQGDLFVKYAHYVWYPTTKELSDDRGTASRIAWFPVLPAGAQLQRHDIPGAGSGAQQGPSQYFELNVKDIAPQPDEEYMPPLKSVSYRVMFYYTSFYSPDDFWKSESKRVFKKFDSFIGPDKGLQEATQGIIAGASTPDDKLRKIYSSVMTLENTSYTREHEKREDKAAGLGKVADAGDVLTHKRGDATEITELFVGMARAAGFNAYVMLVPDRSERILSQGWLSFAQFDDVIAIVSVDGKEVFFDPGSRYCPYAHLPWGATFIQGLRQTDGAAQFATTPGDPYTANRTARVANLTMAGQGEVTGTINLTFVGEPALEWRQKALRGDEESLHRDLREHLEKMLPKGMEVDVKDIKNLQEYEQPLTVEYEAKGHIGTPAGKRLVLPVDLFVAENVATFPHEKRETAVYFPYLERVQDALRINFPKNMEIEAAPASSKFNLQQSAVYNLTVTPAANSITVRRDYAYNEILIPKENYAPLRAFYSQFEGKDQESVVLKAAPVEASAAAKPGGN